MQVAPGHVVSIHYTVRLESGEVIESSEGQPLTYLHGYQPLGLISVEELNGRDIGAEVDCVLPPAKTFGEHDEQKIKRVPRTAFPPTVTLIEGNRYTTTEKGIDMSFTVVEIQPAMVVLDFNHPLAGQSVVVSLKVINVRQASPEELQQGRAMQRANTLSP